MSSPAEAQEMAQDIWPPEITGSVKQSIWKMYRFMKPRVTDRPMTLRRAQTIWLGNGSLIISQEMDALRAAQIEEARHEQQVLRTRLAVLDARASAFDAALAE